MKTIKLLVIACALFSVGAINAKAGENEVQNQAFNELDNQIQKTFMNFPFEEINSMNHECMITLIFTVDAEHQMNNIKVTSEDEVLADFVKNKLERNPIKVNPYFDGKFCRVPVRVVNARK